MHWFAGRVHEVLDEVMGVDPAVADRSPAVCVATLSPAQTTEAVVEIGTARARLDGLEASLLAHAETVDVAAESGATSTAAWLAHDTHVTRGEANRAVRLAKRLSSGKFEATTTALLPGPWTRNEPSWWSTPSTRCQPPSASTTAPMPRATSSRKPPATTSRT